MSQRHVLMRKSGQSRPCQCRVLLRRPRRRRKKTDQVARCRQSGPAAVRRARLAWPQRRRLVCARARRCQSVQCTSTTSRTWKSIRATARPRPSTLGRRASAGTTAGSDLARPSSSRSPSSRVRTAIEPPPHRLRTTPAPPLHTAPAPFPHAAADSPLRQAGAMPTLRRASRRAAPPASASPRPPCSPATPGTSATGAAPPRARRTAASASPRSDDATARATGGARRVRYLCSPRWRGPSASTAGTPERFNQPCTPALLTSPNPGP